MREGFIFIFQYFPCSVIMPGRQAAVADLEGVHGVRSNPLRANHPYGPNYLNFMTKFKRNQVKCRKQTPYGKFEPWLYVASSRNPGSTPGIDVI